MKHKKEKTIRREGGKVMDDIKLSYNDYYFYSLHLNKFVGEEVDLINLLSETPICYTCEQSPIHNIFSEIRKTATDFFERISRTSFI